MVSAKDIVVKPITSQAANALVKRVHYSGKIVNNSTLHLGAYLNDKLEGVMSFGSPLDKRKVLPLVEGTSWNGMLELNRMAFSDRLPKNSESRCLAVAFRLIKKHYPHIEWIISFSDGSQCGDGTIYRASGFYLTGIKKNTSIWKAPSGESFSRTALTDQTSAEQKVKAKQIVSRTTVTKGAHAQQAGGGASMKIYKDAGWEPIPGYQLRYIYFLNPAARQRLTVPILPFSKIDEMGARMYKGVSYARTKQANSSDQLERGGVTPTCTLQNTPKIIREC